MQRCSSVEPLQGEHGAHHCFPQLAAPGLSSRPECGGQRMAIFRRHTGRTRPFTAGEKDELSQGQLTFAKDQCEVDVKVTDRKQLAPLVDLTLNFTGRQSEAFDAFSELPASRCSGHCAIKPHWQTL